MTSRWILVTGGLRNRSALAAVRDLGRAGYLPAVADSGPSLASASRYCARLVEVPAVEDPLYPESIQEVMSGGGYLTLLPAGDRAVTVLRSPGWELLDKQTLEHRARDSGWGTPPGTTFQSAGELAAHRTELQYPIVVKPTERIRTPYKASGPHEVRTDSGSGPLIVQTFLTGPVSSVSGVMWQNELVAAVHSRHLRTWPRDCGVVCAAVTTEPDRSIEKKIRNLLAGFDGIFQVQILEGYLLDLHPRVHGSMPLATAAGVNLAELYCALQRGLRPPPRAARPGARYRWLEKDLRHVVAALRFNRTSSLEGMRALIPHRGTAHSVASIRDPGPLLFQMRQSRG